MTKLKDFDHNKYQRAYRQRHPEKVKQWRLAGYARALERAGWTVIPPVEGAERAE